MERRKFMKKCCISLLALPVAGSVLQSCSTLYYATHSIEEDRLIIPLSEFIEIKKDRMKARKFVLVNLTNYDFPICVYKIDDSNYVSSLLKCTHRGCELNVGGGIYSCPCHGSEFSTNGIVLEGPADENLTTFKTTIENEGINIYFF